MPALLQQLNADLSSIVEQARRGLVQVRSGRHGAGAGTVWHSEGLIITSAHVVSDDRVEVVLPQGPALEARLLARDVDRDVAALMVDATGLPTIPIGDSRRLRPGQMVLALGHPWGIRGAPTAGVVIGLRFEGSPATPSGREWIVASLHLRPGHSGGPLLDAHGRMIGINTMMNGPEVGVAVPVHVVKAFLREVLGPTSTG
ncbi:MAG: trypsin-like peptidase domain-containing protein [Chloroflexi bacterium]|nr:trypsin-like peptidase domain-containing protein [Chloroflexota bacterium]